MGKRSNFERVPRDFYPTPKEAVTPLLPFIKQYRYFAEPCFGNGALAYWVSEKGPFVEFASEIQSYQNVGFEYPENYDHSQGIKWNTDALSVTDFGKSEVIITNPPWSRDVLHPMIDHFRKLLPTWLLFDADWMHTRQAKPYLPYCSKIVSVGRVKWIPDSKHTGKDNCCWYLFNETEQETRFYGR